jgi:hypothetical protein
MDKVKFQWICSESSGSAHEELFNMYFGENEVVFSIWHIIPTNKKKNHTKNECDLKNDLFDIARNITNSLADDIFNKDKEEDKKEEDKEDKHPYFTIDFCSDYYEYDDPEWERLPTSFCNINKCLYIDRDELRYILPDYCTCDMFKKKIQEFMLKYYSSQNYSVEITE